MESKSTNILIFINKKRRIINELIKHKTFRIGGDKIRIVSNTDKSILIANIIVNTSVKKTQYQKQKMKKKILIRQCNITFKNFKIFIP